MNIHLKIKLVAIQTELENLSGVALRRTLAHKALSKAIAAEDVDHIRLHFLQRRMGSMADDYIPDQNRLEYTNLNISLVRTFESAGIHCEPALRAANHFFQK